MWEGVTDVETSITFRVSPEVHRDHNAREKDTVKHEKHIDPDGEFTVVKDENLGDVYKKIFGASVEEYNAKQKRKDRRITDYLKVVQESEHGRENKALKAKEAKRIADGGAGEPIKTKGKHPAYESLLQLGSVANPIDPVIGKAIMDEYVQGWPERNPNLYLYGVYHHADEGAGLDTGAGHYHLDFVPYADGFTRGMTRQCSFNKALQSQGFEVTQDMKDERDRAIQDGDEYVREITEQTLWQESERKVLEEICRQHGISKILTPVKDKKEKTLHEEHGEYRRKKEIAEQAAWDAKKEVTAELNQRHRVVTARENAADERERALDAREKAFKTKVNSDNKELIAKNKELTTKNEELIVKNKELTAKNKDMTINLLYYEKVSDELDVNKAVLDIQQVVEQKHDTQKNAFMKSLKYKNHTVYDEFLERQRPAVAKAIENKVAPIQNNLTGMRRRLMDAPESEHHDMDYGE